MQGHADLYEMFLSKGKQLYLMQLGLGTAQFGLDYGISNTKGKVTQSEIKKIFHYCRNNAIRLIDTAQIYGDAEINIANQLDESYRIITKFSLDSIQKSGSIKDCLKLSFDRLSDSPIDTFMVHSFNLSQGNKLKQFYWQLEQLKHQGQINKIGISLYNSNEITHVLQNYRFDVMQIPINIFDQKLEQSGMLKKIKSFGIEIHARSAYLQGLCFIHPEKLPPLLKAAQTQLNEFRTQAQQLSISLQELALSYLLQIDEITAIILGCTSIKELQENHAIIKKNRGLNLNYRRFNIHNETVTNPMNWS